MIQRDTQLYGVSISARCYLHNKFSFIKRFNFNQLDRTLTRQSWMESRNVTGEYVKKYKVRHINRQPSLIYLAIRNSVMTSISSHNMSYPMPFLRLLSNKIKKMYENMWSSGDHVINLAFF